MRKKQREPLVEYLSRNNNNNTFVLVPIVDLYSISDTRGNNDFEFILTSPSSYVELNHRYEVQALTTLFNKQANTAQEKFGSVIFAHAASSDILSLKDLKGKT